MKHAHDQTSETEQHQHQQPTHTQHDSHARRQRRQNQLKYMKRRIKPARLQYLIPRIQNRLTRIRDRTQSLHSILRRRLPNPSITLARQIHLIRMNRRHHNSLYRHITIRPSPVNTNGTLTRIIRRLISLTHLSIPRATTNTLKSIRTTRLPHPHVSILRRVPISHPRVINIMNLKSNSLANRRLTLPTYDLSMLRPNRCRQITLIRRITRHTLIKQQMRMQLPNIRHRRHTATAIHHHTTT